ncbi:AraC family transcriptional regulator, regulatory protein of adaptative response / DNA-3-methyladenine glycosylase II [Nonomuraea solani]|uniref:AraC family transcriptional regulator, regulatory protein of adaptative response / DNA-3-methyladenine glycosylase II n=1 Tax=Nonomuraea solani TaxID=1144553 RepID=A0A1H6EPJ1_9ACTN|nr:helix-turn-helix domain-containing protein [Nonomuraea solani]SEG99788.1 AraC family transcriptional regulator, regulatory protein of adaptative response / DNA-3-methyladenine glycosylase II [Nonomuraea solani]
MNAVGAVVTTGIYCRDDCPGRPLPSNITRYPSAAAAEAAGYRACHRCRPYRMEPAAVADMPELVCRGVRLIADGALDDVTESGLADRLGVSPRHLRRVFLQHAGVTPDQLARSRRAHFARRLLDDTDLRVADIAFAAGFGSVRQLNRVLADVFHGTPRELRARRRVTDRLQTDGGLAIRLAHDGSLDFAAALRHLAERATPAVEAVSGSSYRRTILVDRDPGLIEITRRSPSELLLVAHLPRLHGLIHHVRRARSIFALDDPATTWGSWDPFEAGVYDIVRAGVADAARARAILGDLAHRYGEVVPGLAPTGLTRMFPRPGALARADLDGLPLPTVQVLRAFAGGEG